MRTIRYLLLLSLLAWLPVSAEETQTLVWPDGTRYVGGVKDGKRSGKGTIFWQDGTRFVGSFVNDLRHGPGTMILPDGTVYNGYFENDALVQQTDARSEPTPPVAAITAGDVAVEPPEEPPVEVDQPTVAANLEQTPSAEALPTKTTEPEPQIETTPAPIPTPTPAQTLTVETRQQVQAAIEAWAEAWSRQDVSAYLAAYSSHFEVPGRQSRRQWEGMRRSRLTRPSRIDVKITYDTFELVAPGRVQVDFNQIYDSNLFSDRTNKRLTLVEEAGNWKIISEASQ